MSHTEYKKMVDMAKRANEEKYEAHSKNILKKHIQTKLKTTMIGALAQFEDLFGELWGAGMHTAELTPEQLEWHNKWQLARAGILNNGNAQSRAALSEIDNYTVKFNKMEYKFVVRKDDQDGKE